MSFDIITRAVTLASQVQGVSPQNVATLSSSIYDFVLNKGATSSEEDASKRENAFASIDCALRANSVGEENLLTTADLIYVVFDGKEDPVPV